MDTFEIKDDENLIKNVEHIKKIMENPKLISEYTNITLPLPIVADAEIGPWGSGIELFKYKEEK